MTDRPGDIGGRQCRGRHLIEQWLEAMMVLSVDYGYVGRCAPEGFGGFQTTEAGPDDHDASIACWHGSPQLA